MKELIKIIDEENNKGKKILIVGEYDEILQYINKKIGIYFISS